MPARAQSFVKLYFLSIYHFQWCTRLSHTFYVAVISLRSIFLLLLYIILITFFFVCPILVDIYLFSVKFKNLGKQSPDLGQAISVENI